MKILVCGANGFIGAALCDGLTRAGHLVVKGVRRPAADGEIAIDCSRDVQASQWLPRLAGIDAVVIAVGILSERDSQRFDDLHQRAPAALFQACDDAGVWRVVQVSALGVETFITENEAPRTRDAAFAAWRPALMRWTLALVWLVTALISAFVYPVSDSLQLLQRVHLQGDVAWVALYGAALIDFGLGIATLRWPSRRLWLLQAGLVSGYTALIAVFLPEFLFHPFGPILKNLPILTLLFLLICEERRP